MGWIYNGSHGDWTLIQKRDINEENEVGVSHTCCDFMINIGFYYLWKMVGPRDDCDYRITFCFLYFFSLSINL